MCQATPNPEKILLTATNCFVNSGNWNPELVCSRLVRPGGSNKYGCVESVDEYHQTIERAMGMLEGGNDVPSKSDELLQRNIIISKKKYTELKDKKMTYATTNSIIASLIFSKSSSSVASLVSQYIEK